MKKHSINWEKKISALITVVLVVAIILCVSPIVKSITYSVPSSDDFWKATIPQNMGIWEAALNRANWFYTNWYGGWIWEFTEVLLNPLIYFGPASPSYGYFLVVCFLLFISILALLVRDFFKYFLLCENRNIWLFSYLMLLFTFLNASIWTEVFYWFCGSTYLRAMTLMLLTLDLIIRNYRKYSLGKSIAITCIGAIACTSYTETIFPGLIFFLFIISDAKRNHSFGWKKAYPLLFMVAGGLTNLLAPGNQARYAYEHEGDSMHITSYLGAFRDAAYATAKELQDLFCNPIVIIYLIMITLLGMYLFSKNQYRFSYLKCLGGIILSLICLGLTYYPFVLGYAGVDYLPNRMQFVFIIYALFSFSLNAISIGGCLTNYIPLKGRILNKYAYFTMMIVLIIFGFKLMDVFHCWGKTPMYRICSLEDSTEYSHDRWIEVIHEIEDSPEQNVVIQRQFFDTHIIKPMGIAEKTDNPQCVKMAKYFGKETLLMEWKY